MTTLLCVHGHYYQPPREDPWTGRIPAEAGAEPYANFNEKITAECYRPNAERGNFGRTSFDVGPTLARWLEAEHPDVDRAIVEQGRGGGAMAQAYNHTILPLATRRDKWTQVRWGIADFEHRFGHRPQGLWLPETAADTETLEALAAHEIAFTILAPWQAAQEELDASRPYRVRLPSGRSIVAFFFDRDLSAAVSFDPTATESAETFVAERLGDAVSRGGLTLIASDGELYGHHQPGRDQFLSDLVFVEAKRAGYEVVLPAHYLELYAVEEETTLAEPTSWSCHHGVARWSTGCACTPGDSEWKLVVRKALTALTEKLDGLFADVGGGLLSDPWAARDDYIHVVLGTRAVEDLVARHASRPLSEAEAQQAILLLEGQWYGQWMYTSCGLFWEELNRLEMRNDLAYAARAIESFEIATRARLTGKFVADLEAAHSKKTGLNGAEVYRDVVAQHAAR